MSNNEADFMYNWIQRHSGKGNSSGSSDNNRDSFHSSYNTHSKESEYCNIHNIKKNSDNLCSVCIEGRNN